MRLSRVSRAPPLVRKEQCSQCVLMVKNTSRTPINYPPLLLKDYRWWILYECDYYFLMEIFLWRCLFVFHPSNIQLDPLQSGVIMVFMSFWKRVWKVTYLHLKKNNFDKTGINVKAPQGHTLMLLPRISPQVFFISAHQRNTWYHLVLEIKSNLRNLSADGGLRPRGRVWPSAEELPPCWHWRLSESLTGSDEWDVLQAVINFPPPCYEHIDLCSMWSALESVVAARSRHWAPGAVAKETKNRADRCLKRFWERKSSFVCVVYHQFKSHRCRSDSWNQCNDFDNDNFISEAHFKAWKWPLSPLCSLPLFRVLQKYDAMEEGAPFVRTWQWQFQGQTEGNWWWGRWWWRQGAREALHTRRWWVAPRWIYFASVVSKN